MDIGSVRLTERHLHDDPPTPEQIAPLSATCSMRSPPPAGRADREAGRSSASPARDHRLRAGQGLDRYDPGRTTTAGYRPRPSGTPPTGCCQHAGRASGEGGDPAGPGRVIGAGALILRVLTDEVGAVEVVVSEKDILDGIAWSIVEKG
jgi:exopolyphosphatase/guanosine-5'-triphosphate,3'-diphosphate pyrophosphatase